MHFGKTIGIIGGGQLGKMMILPANLLGFKTICYSNEEGSPATVFAHETIIGEYNDTKKLLNFAEKCDFLTIEFEAINFQSLKEIERVFPSKLNPSANAVFVSQNRLREKSFFQEVGVKTAEFAEISTAKEALEFFNKNGKFILKTTENGYDGKGQFIITKSEDITPEIPFSLKLIGEKFIPFAFECSVVLTRNASGRVIFFPVPTNIHKEGILHRSIVHNNNAPWKEKCKQMAGLIAEKLKFTGTMAIEFFILENGEILANEMAPRPHNSGHFSLDLCTTSQFETHIRAITDLPIFTPKLLFEGEMLNLIGEEINLVTKFLDKQNAKLHIYGKQSIKEKRKMGHVNFIYDEIFS
jgi:5-(carboxyamino)imidazole ribonucleotide synthase